MIQYSDVLLQKRERSGKGYMDARFFSAIVGNEPLKKRLYSDVSENHLSHAYVLEGPRGSGRHTVALQVAAAIECENRESAGEADLFGSRAKASLPCGVCPSCRKILEGKSPDFITVGLEEDRVSIGVETIRELKNDMYTAPNDLSVKVYVIENADLMTAQAQNAFLLSLEEPPEYVIFFLLCENSTNLLETVRSRAPTLRTHRIETDEIEKYLLVNDSRARALKDENERDWKTLLAVSSGSIGYALELLDPKIRSQIFECRNDAKELIFLLSGSRRSAAFEAIRELGTKRSDVKNRLFLLQYALRDLILLKKSDNAPLCFFEDRDEAQEIASRFTMATLLSLYDSSVTAIDDLDSSANVRLALMTMMQRAGII